MANEKHLAILKQGVDQWNQWFNKNRSVEIDLSRANLQGADLRGINFDGARLYKVKLDGANLSNANLYGAEIQYGSLQNTILRGVDLHYASFRGANLRGADLTDVDLCTVLALDADFRGAILTGACIDDWNTNSSTNFENVICEYIYLRYAEEGFGERRPCSGTFKPGEFTALFQKALETVDLIFSDGIDWQAFFTSFQELREQYDGSISIQAIEKKRSAAFVVRLDVALDADKSAIEAQAKHLYETQLKILEARYEEQYEHLESMRQIVSAERIEKATLMSVLETMAHNQQGPKYDMRGARFYGGFAETVQGNQIGAPQINRNEC